MNILEIGLTLLTTFLTVSFWVALFFEDEEGFYAPLSFGICLMLWGTVVFHWWEVFTTPLW